MVHSRKTLLVVVSMAAAWFASAAEEAMTNADIVRLTQAGIGESAIIAVIESSETDFDTSVASLVALAEAEVGDAVIAAMAASGRPRAAANAPSARSGAPAVPGDGRVGSSDRGRPRAAPGSTFRDTLSSGGDSDGSSGRRSSWIRPWTGSR